jgi:hypothetical protein
MRAENMDGAAGAAPRRFRLKLKLIDFGKDADHVLFTAIRFATRSALANF